MFIERASGDEAHEAKERDWHDRTCAQSTFRPALSWWFIPFVHALRTETPVTHGACPISIGAAPPRAQGRPRNQRPGRDRGQERQDRDPRGDRHPPGAADLGDAEGNGFGPDAEDLSRVAHRVRRHLTSLKHSASRCR